MSKLDSFLNSAIEKHQKELSKHLGDRTLYVGASDIAGCPRKATLGKQTPAEYDTKTLLRFTRGHLAQSMYADFFKAGGATFEEEVEVSHPEHPEILCHIDFLFQTNKKKRLHVVEMKSTNGIPDEPHASWVSQLQVQMGLLKLNNDADVEIGGSILVVDLNAGTYREFNSCYKPNDLVFGHLLEKGIHILSATKGECVPKTEPSFLCGYCPFRTGCPAHPMGTTVELPLEILTAGKAYLELNGQKKEIESRLNLLKENILIYTGGSFKSITPEFSIVASTVAESVTVDSKKLKSAFPDVYEKVTKPKSGFVKLDIKPLVAE